MKYTFIHPTKTGGTACENYFSNYYNNYIVGIGHDHKCTNTNNPIILIRDPIDRFISMYKYWKNGAVDTIFKRNENFINKYNEVNIKKFIELLQNNPKELYYEFTWDVHFAPQVNWINNTDYHNIIIIKYAKNLNKKINHLITILEIPNKNIELNLLNITKNTDESICLDIDDIHFIKDFYKKDYELIEKINNNPELFKLVI